MFKAMKARATIIATYRECLKRGVLPPSELEDAFREEVERNPGAIKAVQPELDALRRRLETEPQQCRCSPCVKAALHEGDHLFGAVR